MSEIITKDVEGSNLIPFSFEGAEVRVLDQAGEPWWVLTDVCSVLEIGHAPTAAKRLDEDEKATVVITDSGNLNADRTIVNESGLWSLVLTSRKPAAKRFKKWITAEVIPSIRKTGGYMVAAPDETPEELALRAVTVLQATLERQREESRRQIEQQKALIDAAAPKVVVHDRIYRANGSLNVTEAAKALQIGPKFLFKWLSTNEWTYRRAGGKSWLGYQARISAGYLEHKVTPLQQSDGSEKLSEQVRITAKGLTKLAKLIPGANLDPEMLPSDPKGPAPVPFAQTPEPAS